MTHYENRVLCYRNPIAHDENHVARDAIRVSREGGNLLLSGTVIQNKKILENHILVTWWATNLLILRKWCGFEKPSHYYFEDHNLR